MSDDMEKYIRKIELQGKIKPDMTDSQKNTATLNRMKARYLRKIHNKPLLKKARGGTFKGTF